MPAFPEAAPAITTDIILYSSDLASYIDTGLKVRTTFEPVTNTCTVAVIVPTNPPRTIAERVIFTGAPETPATSTENVETVPVEEPGTLA